MDGPISSVKLLSLNSTSEDMYFVTCVCMSTNVLCTESSMEMDTFHLVVGSALELGVVFL